MIRSVMRVETGGWVGEACAGGGTCEEDVRSRLFLSTNCDEGLWQEVLCLEALGTSPRAAKVNAVGQRQL